MAVQEMQALKAQAQEYIEREETQEEIAAALAEAKRAQAEASKLLTGAVAELRDQGVVVGHYNGIMLMLMILAATILILDSQSHTHSQLY